MCGRSYHCRDGVGYIITISSVHSAHRLLKNRVYESGTFCEGHGVNETLSSVNCFSKFDTSVGDFYNNKHGRADKYDIWFERRVDLSGGELCPVDRSEKLMLLDCICSSSPQSVPWIPHQQLSMSSLPMIW